MKLDLSAPQRKKLAFVIVLLWLCASVVLLWYYFARPLRPFATYQALDHIDHLSLLAPAEAQITLLHFEDPACHCSRYSREHVRDLVAAYPDYAHLILSPEDVKNLKDSDLIVDKSFEAWVTSSPSVAIFDANGDVLYFGAYSAGAVCGEGFDFVRQVLGDISAPNNKLNLNAELHYKPEDQRRAVGAWKNLSAFGCYCDWPNFKSRQD